ncbi:MAG: SWIB/MDM2 domain-containing protein [Vicinamibacterales bacterium]
MAKTAKKKAAPKKAAPKKKAAAKPAKKAAKPAAKKAAPKKKAARKPNAAFMRPVTPSSTLAEIVGAKPMPRTEVTKKLWQYIKKNGLQDKANKRQINADAKLKAVFGGKSSVNMFAMTKLVSAHLS